jgi:hypothetical protein
VNAAARGALAARPSLSWSATGLQPAGGHEQELLSTRVRIRAALLGLGFGLLAVTIVALVALAIVAGPFHTTPGRIG